MLQGLAFTQRGQGMVLNEIQHPFRIRSRILSERPTNRFLNKKFLRSAQFLYVFRQQNSIRFAFVT